MMGTKVSKIYPNISKQWVEIDNPGKCRGNMEAYKKLEDFAQTSFWVDIFENLDVGWEVSVCFNVQTINVSPLKALQTSMLNGENKESHTIFLGVFCWVFSLYIVMLVAKTIKNTSDGLIERSQHGRCADWCFIACLPCFPMLLQSPPHIPWFEEFYSILLNFHWQVLTMSYP